MVETLRVLELTQLFKMCLVTMHILLRANTVIIVLEVEEKACDHCCRTLLLAVQKLPAQKA